jgi:hypothetical protein
MLKLLVCTNRKGDPSNIHLTMLPLRNNSINQLVYKWLDLYSIKEFMQKDNVLNVKWINNNLILHY